MTTAAVDEQPDTVDEEEDKRSIRRQGSSTFNRLKAAGKDRLSVSMELKVLSRKYLIQKLYWRSKCACPRCFTHQHLVLGECKECGCELELRYRRSVFHWVITVLGLASLSFLFLSTMSDFGPNVMLFPPGWGDALSCALISTFLIIATMGFWYGVSIPSSLLQELWVPTITISIVGVYGITDVIKYYTHWAPGQTYISAGLRYLWIGYGLYAVAFLVMVPDVYLAYRAFGWFDPVNMKVKRLRSIKE